jgi:hypothetical protein
MYQLGPKYVTTVARADEAKTAAQTTARVMQRTVRDRMSGLLSGNGASELDADS